MKIYESKTGYVRRITDGTCSEAKTIYLGKIDKAENYEDTTKAVYTKWVDNQLKNNKPLR